MNGRGFPVQQKKEEENMSENRNAVITDIPVAMGTDEFVEAMRERLQEQYPDCEVRATPVMKNNDTRWSGITIFTAEGGLAPTIYVDGLYREYLEGSPMEELVSEYIRRYEESDMEPYPALPDITDFGAVKDLVCLRLVNRGRNRESLKGMPHRDFLDLAVTYFIPVTLDGTGDGRIAVTNRQFGLWGVDEDTLYRHALENTRRLLPVSLKTLEELVREITGGSYPEGLSRKEHGIPCPAMYVLMCGNQEHSTAAALLDTPILQKFAKEHGDFYILPSSIYEVILVPAGPGPADAKYYSGMVRDVNRTSLSPEEILSDNAYYYHAGTGEIEILA